MIFREALVTDIPQLFEVRYSVRENVLSDPGLVTGQAVRDYLTRDGKGWVVEEAGLVAGFGIVGLAQKSVWALFVRPEYESRGLGSRLLQIMLDWYFGQTRETVWLSTGAGTRAEEFYRRAGWQETGRLPKGEIRFEMTYHQWQHRPGQPAGSSL
jgi:GNAT superfamily N-acetyltransferase